MQLYRVCPVLNVCRYARVCVSLLQQVFMHFANIFEMGKFLDLLALAHERTLKLSVECLKTFEATEATVVTFWYCTVVFGF